MDFRLTRELGEKMAEKWEKSPENGSKIGFLSHFCHFSAFFLPSSLVRPEAIFRPFLPDFGPKARRQSLAGQWENLGLSLGQSRGRHPRATGPKSSCLCAFFLPETKAAMTDHERDRVVIANHALITLTT